MQKLILPEQQILIDNAWLNLDKETLLDPNLFNPLAKKTREDLENPHHRILRLMMNPDYFGFTCKYLLNKELHPFQLAILKELWIRPFPMFVGARGCGKTTLLAIYAMLRATLNQGSKIVVVGAAFRQSKYVFEYCEDIWRNAPILRDICGRDKAFGTQGPRRDVDRCTLRIGDSIIVALPIGDGQKIRGQRATHIIADEFASINVDIYETVISGFAAVSSNPMEKVKHGARIEAMKNLGLLTKEQADTSLKSVTSNQSIVSGSADYGFKHFCDYWKRWKGIVESKGDTQKLQEVFNGKIPENFNWRDYSIIRMPSKLLPNLFMDKNTLSKAKATMHLSNYLMEYEAVFAMDSDGFFKRSLIESCVVGNPKNPIMGKLGEIAFSAMLRGMPGRKYIMAVDPASESDNFAIVILECWEDHRRIVYCWTTTRAKYKERLKAGKAEEQEFYGYCARKIRDLLALFKPCERIVLDSQGGGIAVMEALHDPVRLREGEIPIWEIVDRDKPKDTDNKVGAHILEMIQFADSSWVSEANHGMKKDFEDKTLLFPPLDSVALGLAMEDDKLMGREDSPYDLLEDCMFEIEELKNELATIVHTQTGISLRDRWSTPEIKQPGGKKGRLRKDRYSALLMANMSARTLSKQFVPEYHGFLGGIVQDVAKQKVLANMPVLHQNPDWYIKAIESVENLGAVVTRR